MKFLKAKRILCAMLSMLMVMSFLPMQSLISASATENPYSDGITDYLTDSTDDYTIDSAEQLAGLAGLTNNGGSDAAGGIVGYVPGSGTNSGSDTSIENCYNESGIQGSDSSAGGIVGTDSDVDQPTEGIGNCTGDHSGYSAISATGQTITDSGKYYLSCDIIAANYGAVLTVDCSGEVTICLNGHQLKQDNTQVNAQSVLFIKNGTVNLCDCVGTGYLHHRGNHSAAYLQNSSVLNMYGGTIKDTYRFIGGSAVYASGTSTFNMYGGTITNNYVGINGDEVVLVASTAKFNMYGGDITANNAVGYMVHYDNTYFSGDVKINGNTKGNLFLKSGKTITVGKLTEGADIWVNAEASGNVAITGQNDSDVSKYFHSEDSNRVIINKDNVVMLHAHEWTPATCTSAKYCNYCGKYEGEKNPENHSSDETYFKYSDASTHSEYYSCCDGLKETTTHNAYSAATCQDVAFCDVCKEAYGSTDPENHTSDETYFKYSDASTHSEYYSCCDGLKETTTHNAYSVATCQDVAFCDVCKEAYGSIDPENHTGTLSYVDLEDGTHIQKWDCCGANVGEAVEHTFNCANKDDAIYAVCSECKKDVTINFIFSDTVFTYDGTVKTPEVTLVTSDGDTLVKDVDYTVAYSSGRKNPGTYNVTVTLKGKYTGTRTLPFTIKTADISDCTVKLSSTNYTYNGKVKTPTVSVKNSIGTTLTKNTHYTVTYADGRTKVGTYKVTVTMKGYYTGTKTLTFKINPISIDTCTIKLSKTSYTYNAKVQTPTVSVKNVNGVALTKDTHFTVSYSSGRKNAGTYKVTVTMKGHYSGTKTLSYKINPINISTCTVKLSTTSYTYNSKVRTPGVSVKNASGTTLTKGTHYTVAYSSGRINAGTYKVTVTMKGNYAGTKTLSFKINPIDISTCTVKLSKTSYTYNSKVRTPSVSVKNSGGTALTKDTHYTVAYSSGRINAGTYKVTVTMKGNYTGTKTLSFKINPIKIDTCTLKLSATSYTYDGKVKSPTVSVKNAGGAALTKGTHFTYSYATTRKAVGKHKVTVTMKGNYTGTKDLYFTIKPPYTTINSLSAGSKSISVKINNIKSISGYQVIYSTSKDFSSSKTVSASVTSAELEKATKTIKLSGLTSGKTYYVKVRAYKTVSNVKYYAGWSSYKYTKAK